MGYSVKAVPYAMEKYKPKCKGGITMVAITTHAQRRLKERAGMNKNTARKVAERAYCNGISFDNASSDIRQYISKVYTSHDRIANNIRIYGNIVYIFDNRTLITVFQMPQELVKQIEEYAESIDAAGDKAYKDYIAEQKNKESKLNKMDSATALNYARKCFSHTKYKPYKFSFKCNHIEEYIQLSFVVPKSAQKYGSLFRKIELKTGYKVIINQHMNTALFEKEISIQLRKYGINLVKPISYYDDTAIVYISDYTPICDIIKKRIEEQCEITLNYKLPKGRR